MEKQIADQRLRVRIGIVGGLGAKTSCDLFYNLNEKVRENFNFQPEIVMENVSVSKDAEKKIINGCISREMRQALFVAIKNLNKTNVDFIAIPCNSVHIFLKDLQKSSYKPILNIPKLCAKRCKDLGLRKVGILGTQITINHGLHQKALFREGINAVVPAEKTQSKINKAILFILNNENQKRAKRLLEEGMFELKNSGVQAVILGCTDIQIVLDVKKSSIPIIDTLEILENSLISLITKDERREIYAK